MILVTECLFVPSHGNGVVSKRLVFSPSSYFPPICIYFLLRLLIHFFLHVFFNEARHNLLFRKIIIIIIHRHFFTLPHIVIIFNFNHFFRQIIKMQRRKNMNGLGFIVLVKLNDCYSGALCLNHTHYTF